MSLIICCKSRKPAKSLNPQPHSLSISQQPLPTPSPVLDLNIVGATSIRGPISAEEEVGRGGWTTATSIRSVDANLNALVTPSIYSNITAEAPAPLPRAVFGGLKTILYLINETAGIFPPLKSATGVLLGLIDVIETTTQNKQDRADLEQKLVAVCSILQSQCDHSSASIPFQRRIEGLLTAINHQISVIRNQNERNLVRRAAENREDAEEIDRAYRTLSCLFDAFQMDTTMSTERITEEILSHTLLEKLPRVNSAEYNSSSPTQRNGCMEKTREAILAGLMSWATDSDVTNTKIYWLNGMAGTGKTTIAYSFAEILDKIQMLGATFFCSRLEDDASVFRIFPSIAYQMAVRFPSMGHALVDVIRRDPDAGHRLLRRQFSDLIVTPLKLRPINGTAGVIPIIIIDALDECANQNMAVEILSIISQYASTLPVKFFITSRPEQNIRFNFNRQDLTLYSKFVLHDVEAEIVNADIGIYMRNHLAAITHERYGGVLLDHCPSELQFETLIHRADKLFIYASTVCDYISKGDNVKRRLEAVTQGNLNGKTETLDGLYSCILHDAYTESDDEERPDIEQVLRVVTSALSPLSVKGISDILHIDTSRVTAALSPLHSVIHVPSNSDLNVSVSTFHASFSDYIHERERSGNNFLDPSRSHRLLALQCFETMQMFLKENICHLEENSPITGISSSTIAENISEGLAYACTHWVSHVVRATLDFEDDATDNLYYERVRQLFDQDLLRWVECMSLLGRLGIAMSALRSLEMCQWAKTRLELRIAAIDARRFISESFELLNNRDYCLETYGSALVWLPELSQIRRLYADRRKPSWKITCGLRKEWSVSETTLTPTGLSDPTNCAAFSPDGTRLVSVAHDDLKSPRVWNTTTGTREAELRGHSDSVTSILFSPDGNNIVSASYDKSLRIWNTVTGKCGAELTGHSDWVIVVVFSPDSTYVLSASHDKSLRVWNTRTGKCKATLIPSRHTDWLNSAVFSPDATLLAAASLNNSLLIFNTATGECEADLRGHSGSITSVVFSPDGTCLLSASHDESLRIWNIATSKCQELRGHSDSVTSVAFSPDGSQFVSASYDRSLRIWDRFTGKCQVEMKGHSGPVTSAVFSPDASCVISASYDNSLRIWNTVTGECREELTGHSGPVTSVTTHGTRILSTSHDQSLRIWDMATGKCEAELRGHPGSITSVAFSFDGTRLVSASYDNSLRIWNTVTGKCDAELMGHPCSVTSVVFSADGICTSASTSYDESLQMDAVVSEQEAELRHPGLITSVAFSPDGARIVSASYNQLQIWNTVTKECEVELRGHPGSITSVAFSPDGTHVVSASDKKSLHLWDVQTGDFKVFGDHMALSDGIQIHCYDDLSIRFSHSQGDQSTPLPLLEIDGPWIRHRNTGQRCWIPSHLRHHTAVAYNTSRVCLGLDMGDVLVVEHMSTTEES